MKKNKKRWLLLSSAFLFTTVFASCSDSDKPISEDLTVLTE